MPPHTGACVMPPHTGAEPPPKGCCPCGALVNGFCSFVYGSLFTGRWLMGFVLFTGAFNWGLFYSGFWGCLLIYFMGREEDPLV